MAASRPVILMGAGILGGIGLLVYGRDDFKTPGIKNIENRHTAAGGSASSTPAQASPMGDMSDGAGRHGGNAGPDSPNHQANFGEQYGTNSKAGKNWQQTMHDSDKGVRKS